MRRNFSQVHSIQAFVNSEITFVRASIPDNLDLKAEKIKLSNLPEKGTLSYPETHVLELDVELIDLKQQQRNLEQQIQSIQSQLSITNKELLFQQNALILEPITCVIWSIDSQSQEIVEANKSIIQLLNCQNLWVEAFINETDASKLVVGQEAQINFDNSSNVQWKGQVETIKVGTGRFEVGQYVINPPPEITRRQLPVRVATVRIKVDWQKYPRFDNFSLAGRSVNVRFIESKSSPF